MSRLDDAIADVAYVLDSLMALRRIYQTGRECNTCAKSKTCEHAPRAGEIVRFNCFDYAKAKGENDE